MYAVVVSVWNSDLSTLAPVVVVVTLLQQEKKWRGRCALIMFLWLWKCMCAVSLGFVFMHIKPRHTTENQKSRVFDVTC